VLSFPISSPSLSSILSQVSAWSRLGQQESCPTPASRGHHELEHRTRTQSKCAHCDFRLASVDEVLDAECSDEALLFTGSPRQQRDAMDDSFLEDLDNPRNRRLKRQWECLATSFQPKEILSNRPKFVENLRLPTHTLFPKKKSHLTHGPSSQTPVPSLPLIRANESNEDLLVSVVIEADDRCQPHALNRTVLLLHPRAKISDVVDAVAGKLCLTVRALLEEFSTRDQSSGAFLGLDDDVVNAVLLRARSLSD
jgi:hypothetical protein